MNKSKSKKWIISFFAIVLAIVIVLVAVAYIVDPFFQFRVRDNSYKLNGWFVGSGLIKNYDYDTLIIGSSMAQNFDMDVFREEMGVKPLHVCLGGLRQSEALELVHAAYEAGKAKTYYICVDRTVFTNEVEESRYPEHLLKDDVLSKMRYLLSYEVWFRYIPVDTGLAAADKLGINLPASFEYERSIDKLGDWRLDFPETGKDVVLANYKAGKYAVSDVDTDNLYERMIKNIDKYLEGFDYEKGEHVFFFPPYSSLFWCEARIDEYFEPYLEAKDYFIDKANKLGATVYDFQADELSKDLDNYKDMTHFLPPVNDWMVKCFADKTYIVTPENRVEYKNKLIENTDSFKKEYAYLFDN